MVYTRDPQRIAEAKPMSQASNDMQSNSQNLSITEAPGQDPGSSSIAGGNDREIYCEEVRVRNHQVQKMIECCLILYMDKGEAVRNLFNKTKVEPITIAHVWDQLEEKYPEFFRAYYMRAKLKKQILLFNLLLEHQYHMMKCSIPPKNPLAPVQIGTRPICAVNNLSMECPVHQPKILRTGQLQGDLMDCGLSSSHEVNRIPAPGNFPPIHMNTGNDNGRDSGTSEVAPSAPQYGEISSMSGMVVSPALVASSNHILSNPPELSMGMYASAPDTILTSAVLSSGQLQLAADGGGASSRFLFDSSNGELQLGADGGFASSRFTSDVVSNGEFQQVADGGVASSRFTDLTDFGDFGDLNDYACPSSDWDSLFDPNKTGCQS